MDVVERARADLAAGRAWKARDRLNGALVHRADDAVLGLLGEVCFAMQDLPAAGAAWFGTARGGDDVDAALAAWRERHGDAPDELWRSLPWPVRATVATNDRVAALALEVSPTQRRRRPAAERRAVQRAADATPTRAFERVLDVLLVGLGVVVLLFVLASVGVGAVTIVRPLWP